MAKIGMIGAGSWGTALTWLLTNNGHQVTVWSALADEITMLQEKHEQTSKLPGVILDDSVVFTTDLKAAVEDHRKRCKGRGRKHADDAFSDH